MDRSTGMGPGDGDRPLAGAAAPDRRLSWREQQFADLRRAAADPIFALERNNASTRHAVRHLGITLGAWLIAIVVGWIVGLALDDGHCSPEGGVLCTVTGRWTMWWLPCVVLALRLGWCLWRLYMTWYFHIRWRPWLLVMQLEAVFVALWFLGMGGVVVGPHLSSH